MSQQDDRPEDAATEWLSPALYRQLCDAVDAALSAPPDARDALLAARLGSDQRLLAEAHALLASHEESPRTFITPAVGAAATRRSSPARQRRHLRRGPDSDATFSRRDSATVIVAGSGSRRAYQPDARPTPTARRRCGRRSLRAPAGAAPVRGR